METNIINADNVKISANFTGYIENHPILFFILALRVIILTFGYCVLPRVLQVWQERWDKSDIGKIKQDTTAILALLREEKWKK